MKNVNDKLIITDADVKMSIIKNRNDYTVNVLDNNNEITHSEDKNKDDTISINNKIVVLGSSTIGKYRSLSKTLSGGSAAAGLGLGISAPLSISTSSRKASTSKILRTSRRCERYCGRKNQKVSSSGKFCACVGNKGSSKKK